MRLHLGRVNVDQFDIRDSVYLSHTEQEQISHDHGCVAVAARAWPRSMSQKFKRAAAAI